MNPYDTPLTIRGVDKEPAIFPLFKPVSPTHAISSPCTVSIGVQYRSISNRSKIAIHFHYRAFETLEGAGAIAREGKTIRILSRDALKNVISENRRESLP